MTHQSKMLKGIILIKNHILEILTYIILYWCLINHTVYQKCNQIDTKTGESKEK